MATKDAKTIEDTIALIAVVELSSRAEDLIIELIIEAEDIIIKLLSIANNTNADVKDRGVNTTSKPTRTNTIDNISNIVVEDIIIDKYNSKIIPKALK